MSAAWLPMAQALETWLEPQLGPLSLAEFRIDRQQAPHPRYPARPRTDCPRLLIRNYTFLTKPRVGGQTDFDIALSLWFYRRQIAGEEHQERLMEALDFINGLLRVQRLPELLCQAGARFMQVGQTIVHDELLHPLGDPNLRVSPGEIQVMFQADSR